MQPNQLDLLEIKVKKILTLIEKIQAEKDQLQKDNLHLKKIIKSRESEIERIKDEYKHLKKNTRSSSLFIEKEREIKDKIEGMLAKLDSIENIPPL
ncbi:hypothetical protein GF337_07410 [candidate division KSB1 bacterium]|nr:hypothetical protein [candidate division KSB1 bacterium]